MDHDFWHERWREGRIHFHASEVNPNLVRHHETILTKPGSRVLVPLCGKTVDLLWLAERGHHPVGVELSDIAAAQFFAEAALEKSTESTERFTRHRSTTNGRAIEILVADLFDLSAADVGDIDAVWDRAALVALPPQTRPRYCDKVRSLGGEAPILVNSFTYDQSIMDGPPFSVDETAVRSYFDGKHIERLHHEDVIDRVRFKERGHAYWWSSTYLIS